ncbi:hypothetical protein CC85DRAFT_300290 [Cutaneotrichosporon oleaginosum]|uniref:Uncharacterized protein n=1 Tax=Cutaneotrichosporon oleaginosum TaxID=879819 RepID=A0A0J0XUL9_9TREE|nr:uncharacterized protein CC85DRAFT_300290 [Cutaneotrichosporon oleaginosum]KLT44747.1 hypothetical protein CC85DRAFT_300290 [Cutaneotrichosporon oleaginosum]TXT07733.1 hypothetical protein COLE_04657 [Cutaneotrichosporon oleaginosum]
MPIRVDTRDNLRPKRPAANKLPLRRHEVTPEDRASNVEASSSEESEEDIDNVLARLGKKCEIADPMERFVKWYNDVNYHLNAGSLDNISSLDGAESQETPVTGASVGALGSTQRAKPKTTTSPTSAAARPTLHVKTASPATKRLAAVKQAASRPPPTTAKSTETEAHPKKKPTAGKRKVPPALKPAPARTRIFYARRAKETSESALAPGRLPS